MVGCWSGYLSGARCRLAYSPGDATALTVSCFREIQIGFTFLVPAHPGSPGQRAIKRMCVSVLCFPIIAPCFRQTPRHHPTTQFFTGQMPFLPPNQQRQSTEGKTTESDHFYPDTDTPIKDMVLGPYKSLQPKCTLISLVMSLWLTVVMNQQTNRHTHPATENGRKC